MNCAKLQRSGNAPQTSSLQPGWWCAPAWALLIGLALADSAAALSTLPEVGRTPITANALAPLRKTLQVRIDKEIDKRRAAGLGIALLADGQVLWIKAAGRRSRESSTAFDVDTPLPMGEVSRLFLAALTLDLVAQEKLDLDAPVAGLLPTHHINSRFAQARPITVRDLLTHHSGLPYAQLRGTYQLADAALEALDPQAWYLVQPTGTVQVVSNLGYELLGQVIEAAAGESIDALFASRLAVPLALRNSGWQQFAGLAPGHRKGKVQPRLVARERAALGMNASLADLARLVSSLMPGDPHLPSPLDHAMRAQMFALQNAQVPLDLGNAVGLGWNLSTSVRPRVGRIASLVGVFPATRVEVRLALDHGLGVVGVGNWDELNEPLGELGADALDGLLSIRADTPPRDRDRMLPERVPLPAGVVVDALPGFYATAAGLVRIEPRDAQQFELDLAGLAFRARARGDGWYALRYDLLGMIPIGFSRLNRIAVLPARLHGERVALGFVHDRHLLLGTAFEPDPESARWAEFTGTYRLLNPDFLSRLIELDQATLSFADGVLTLDYEIGMFITLKPRLPLTSLGDGLFVLAGRGVIQGEQVRLDHLSDPPRLHYSGYLLERVAD